MWGGNLSHRSVRFYHTYTKNKRRGAEGEKKRRGSAARKEGEMATAVIFMLVSVIFRWLSSTAINNALYNSGHPIPHNNKTIFPWKRPSKARCVLIIPTSHLRFHLISTRREQRLTVCFLEMLIVDCVIGGMGESYTIFLHPPPPGHLQKVIQDFQFGLSDLHLLSVLCSFFFF